MFLQHHFLISMPGIKNITLQETVIYICEHNKNGAMGIIINKIIQNLTIKNILNKLNIHTSTCLFGRKINDPIIMGGWQAEDRGFILHSSKKQFHSSIKISDNTFMTTSRDILESINYLDKPYNLLVALGYCVWGKNQLEKELLKNYWLTTSANNNILFHTPIENRWKKASEEIGIDISRLSNNYDYV